MRRVASGLVIALGIAGGFLLAAPVPMPPVEDLRAFKTVKEFDAATLDLADGRITANEDRNKGYRLTTAKGTYTTYFTSDGVMILSTIPDGKLKYGYFDFEAGAAIRWNGQLAPEGCVACHNRNREK